MNIQDITVSRWYFVCKRGVSSRSIFRGRIRPVLIRFKAKIREALAIQTQHQPNQSNITARTATRHMSISILRSHQLLLKSSRKLVESFLQERELGG